MVLHHPLDQRSYFLRMTTEAITMIGSPFVLLQCRQVSGIGQPGKVPFLPLCSGSDVLG